MVNTINVSESTNLEPKNVETLWSTSNISEKVDHLQSSTEVYTTEIHDMKIKVDEEKNRKMDGLLWQLHEESDTQNQVSIFHDCEERIADWKTFFYALQWDQEKIQRKIQELDNSRLWHLSWFLQSQYFLGLNDLSEKDLKDEYMKYFEFQTSEYYLWSVINAVLSKSFNIGFFCAMKWTDWIIDEKFSQIIHIVQKLIRISKTN